MFGHDLAHTALNFGVPRLSATHWTDAVADLVVTKSEVLLHSKITPIICSYNNVVLMDPEMLPA